MHGKDSDVEEDDFGYLLPKSSREDAGKLIKSSEVSSEQTRKGYIEGKVPHTYIDMDDMKPEMLNQTLTSLREMFEEEEDGFGYVVPNAPLSEPEYSTNASVLSTGMYRKLSADHKIEHSFKDLTESSAFSNEPNNDTSLEGNIAHTYLTSDDMLPRLTDINVRLLEKMPSEAEEDDSRYLLPNTPSREDNKTTKSSATSSKNTVEGYEESRDHHTYMYIELDDVPIVPSPKYFLSR